MTRYDLNWTLWPSSPDPNNLQAHPTAYGGVAYTLQTVTQRQTPAGYTVIILVLKIVFTALGGWLLLGETMGHCMGFSALDRSSREY
mgnify:CR=1 FL=1